MKSWLPVLFLIIGTQICRAQTATNSVSVATSKPKWLADKPLVPVELPGKGLAQHDFFYAGEAKAERMLMVRNGRIAWDYTHSTSGEISDAVLEPNRNILFAHQHGVTEITLNMKTVWDFVAPTNTEIHTAMPYGSNSVWFIQNGDPAKFILMNKTSGAIENQFVLAVANPKKAHPQFRHARITNAGTLLVAHMDLGRAAEYDLTGKELWSMDVPGIWSATPLKNGNILVVSNQKFVREINRAKKTVWEWTPADAPDYKFSNLQLAVRLSNGNTIINNWFNQWNGTIDAMNAPMQAIEVTQDKKQFGHCTSGRRPLTLARQQLSKLCSKKASGHNRPDALGLNCPLVCRAGEPGAGR